MTNIELIDSLLQHIYERRANINADKMLVYFAEYTRRRKDKSHDPLTAKPMNDDGLDPQDIAVIQCVADFALSAHSPLSEQEEDYAVSKLQLGYVQILKRALSNTVNKQGTTK